MKKLALIIVVAAICSSAAFCTAFLSANDMEPAKLASELKLEDTIIKATSDKGVTIEATEAREASDGEIFNLRIKLNGTGNATYRSIGFHALAGETLTVYLNSSSKTDSRILVLAKADGTQVTTLVADPDTGKSGLQAFVIADEGDYFVYSKSSGINIYQLIVE